MLRMRFTLRVLTFSLLVGSCSCRRAVFLVGDSTSQRLYKAGLAPLCAGQSDPLVKKNFEHNGCRDPLNESSCMYNDHGLLCSKSSPFIRLGYTIHWGVHDQPYHKGWVTHRSLNDTTNSSVNIALAIQEFQRRSQQEGSAVFFFLSNLWDVKRYEDHFFASQAPLTFAKKYRESLVATASAIQLQMRPSDTLVLCTCHLPAPPLTSFVHIINEEVRSIAKHHNIPLFDESQILGENCTRSYLKDRIHQTVNASALLAAVIANIVNSSLNVSEQNVVWRSPVVR